MLAQVLQEPVRVRRRFVVERDDVGAGLTKIVDVLLGLDDHQVAIERQRGQLAQIGDDLRAPGEVRHETAVHRVQVQRICAGSFDHFDLVRDVGEIGREQRGREFDRRHQCAGADGVEGCLS